jgi:hypothetical protein
MMFSHLYDQLDAIQDYERAYQELLLALYPDPAMRQHIDADYAARNVPFRSRVAGLMLDSFPVVPGKRSVQ